MFERVWMTICRKTRDVTMLVYITAAIKAASLLAQNASTDNSWFLHIHITLEKSSHPYDQCHSTVFAYICFKQRIIFKTDCQHQLLIEGFVFSNVLYRLLHLSVILELIVQTFATSRHPPVYASSYDHIPHIFIL